MRRINNLESRDGAAVSLATRDGRSIRVRHIRSEDANLLVAMFWQLSSESRWRRFFVPLDNIEADHVEHEAQRLAAIDPDREVALIALADENNKESAIAVARYARFQTDADYAEASIVVRDDYQGAGLGQQLFDLLIQTALAQGITHMILLTHADNYGMIGLIHRLGMPYTSKITSGLCEIDLCLIDATPPVFPSTEPASSQASAR